MLDLDHARAQVPEQHRAERARQDPRQIEDQDFIERSGHRASERRYRAAGRQPSWPGRK